MPRVRVFSTPACPYCFTLKEFLKDNGIEFEDIDVAKDVQAREEMVKGSGQIGVPVIAIDDEFMVGFDRAKICQLLNIKD